jgi:hypothetical protein
VKRVILVNNQRAPSRLELVSTERQAGESLFHNWPGLQWAGYIHAEGHNRLAANWIIPEQQFQEFASEMSGMTTPTHDVLVYQDSFNEFGGQCERLVA